MHTEFNQFVFGADPKFFPTLVEKHLIHFGGVTTTNYQIIVLVVAVIFMGLLQYIIYGTKFGRAMRAVSFNFETASLMGIPTDRVISMTFIIGSVLAAVAGILYGLRRFEEALVSYDNAVGNRGTFSAQSQAAVESEIEKYQAAKSGGTLNMAANVLTLTGATIANAGTVATTAAAGAPAVPPVTQYGRGRSLYEAVRRRRSRELAADNSSAL